MTEEEIITNGETQYRVSVDIRMNGFFSMATDIALHVNVTQRQKGKRKWTYIRSLEPDLDWALRKLNLDDRRKEIRKRMLDIEGVPDAIRRCYGNLIKKLSEMDPIELVD